VKRSIRIFAMVLVSMLAGPVLGDDDQISPYVYPLVSEDPGQIRSASNRILDAGITDPELMDILMEVVLENAHSGEAWTDSLAWGTKALMNSENPRYYTALKSISEDKSVHKKLRKYAKKAAKGVGDAGDIAQYTEGMVDLAIVREEAVAARQEMAKNLKGAEGYESIGIVEPGMSAGEVTARCGQPSSISSHITGKQFIPFNFKGGDTVRSYYLYKGQGVVVVANDSAWTNGTHVIEVQFDENEPGFR